MKFFLMVLIAVSMLILGCATGKIIIPDIQNDFELHSDFDTVWSAVIESLVETPASIESVEKVSGLITTNFIMFFNSYAERLELDRLAEKPDYNFLAKWMKGRLKYNIFVKSISDTLTRIKITSYMEALVGGIAPGWEVVYSKGIVEDDLHKLIRSKL